MDRNRHGLSAHLRQLALFGWAELRCCAFATALLGGIALAGALPPLPVAPYDLLLAYGVLLSAAFCLLGLETRRDLAVVAACHVLGLAFELVKVRAGSWSYPDPAWTKVAGVPLYSGFMYAAVGSYACSAWRLLDLRLTGYRARLTATLATLLYLNFLTHHWLPDLRWPLSALLLAATASTWVHFRVGERRHRMPLALSFALIGFFLWLAENIATYLGAWSYPHQLDGWQPVSLSKWASWSLLITLPFVISARGRPSAGRREPAGSGGCSVVAGTPTGARSPAKPRGAAAQLPHSGA